MVNRTVCRPAAFGGATGGWQDTEHGGEPSAQRYGSTSLAHGQVVGDTWHKRVAGSRHMLRQPQAWAVDEADLAAAERLGAEFVAIYDQEAGRCYWANIETIRRHGFTFNRGFGDQVALPLDRWAASKAEASLADADGVEQLALGLGVAL